MELFDLVCENASERRLFEALALLRRKGTIFLDDRFIGLPCRSYEKI